MESAQMLINDKIWHSSIYPDVMMVLKMSLICHWDIFKHEINDRRLHTWPSPAELSSFEVHICCYLSLFAVVLRMNSRTFFQGSLVIPLKPVYQNKQRHSDTKMGFLGTSDIPVIIKSFFFFFSRYLCWTNGWILSSDYHAIELYCWVPFIDFLHWETDFNDNITFQDRPTMSVFEQYASVRATCQCDFQF